MLGRMAMLSAIAVLVAYARLVGGGASVDRATLMAVLYFAARLIDQRSPPLNTLAFVAACLVATQPLSVLDPAFVLTFGATLAILWIASVVRAWSVPPLLAPAASMLAASAATELILLPVGALVFARVTFAGLVLNFAAIPLMAVVQVAGMALVPVSLVSTRAAAVLGWRGACRGGRPRPKRRAGAVRAGSVVSRRPTALVGGRRLLRGDCRVDLLVAPSASPSGWRLARRPARRSGSSRSHGRSSPARGDGRLHVTFLDVGQGDAALVRFPRGAAMLVDAGGLTGSSFDIGDRVVAPVLRAAGVRRLDAVVLTHGDPDHIGGAASVIREFRPRQVWEGIVVPSFEPLRALRAEAQAVRRDVGQSQNRRSDGVRRCRGGGAASGRAGLGAADESGTTIRS